MSRQPHGPSDERVEQILGNLLRVGVLASALVVLAGGVLFLLQDGRQPAPDLHEFRKQPQELRSPIRIVRESASAERHVGAHVLRHSALEAGPAGSTARGTVQQIRFSGFENYRAGASP